MEECDRLGGGAVSPTLTGLRLIAAIVSRVHSAHQRSIHWAQESRLPGTSARRPNIDTDHRESPRRRASSAKRGQAPRFAVKLRFGYP